MFLIQLDGSGLKLAGSERNMILILCMQATMRATIN